MIGLHVLGVILLAWLDFYYERLSVEIFREPDVSMREKWISFPLTLLMWGGLTWAVTLFCFYA